MEFESFELHDRDREEGSKNKGRKLISLVLIVVFLVGLFHFLSDYVWDQAFAYGFGLLF